MRSKLARIAAIVLLVCLASSMLNLGEWLDLALQHREYHLDDIIIAFVALSCVLIIFLVRGWRDLSQEAAARTLLIAQMEQQATIEAQLSQMTNLLHSCFVLEEAGPIISHFACQLFPTHIGALYLFRNSRNVVEVAAAWGEQEGDVSFFAPHQCWALRQGQVYEVSDPQRSVLCLHVSHTRPYMCLPMMAHGEVLALLHISATSDAASSAMQRALVQVFSERVGLALSNLKLRDTLRQQSIRDPLTGLFNRRYLEETLTIEIERAKRNDTPFSVMMLDVDHFKRLNDTYGHDAGDTVLQALGRFLQQHVRGGDIACRFGGEEFTLLLPDTTLEIAQARAEQLCEGVRALPVDVRGESLGSLTLSAGIATYPQHGEDGGHVLLAADKALYHAKSKGRDQAVVAV